MYLERLFSEKGSDTIKRVGNLFKSLISDANIVKAITIVNDTHKYMTHHRPNTITQDIKDHEKEYVEKLRQIVLDGYTPKPYFVKERYDPNAKKVRIIREPAQYPDQYIHHMLIQVIQPVMMRGMDYWCCGSIPKRGSKKVRKALKKWTQRKRKSSKWTAEADIRHFYDTLPPEVVMDRMKHLIKDKQVLDLIWRIIKDGVVIGCYTSQWFGNVTLQPLDVLIRQTGVKHYVRYMDNFTLQDSNKKRLRKAINVIKQWLEEHGMELKGDWQIYRTDVRMPRAVGYRYGRKKVLLRKQNLLRIKRQVARYRKRVKEHKKVSYTMAAGLISRLGQLNHCDCVGIRKKYIPNGTLKNLKLIVKEGPPWKNRLKQESQNSMGKKSSISESSQTNQLKNQKDSHSIPKNTAIA